MTPPPCSNPIAKLFISYGRQEDDEFVAKLCDKLKSEGFDVWRDVADLPNRGLYFPAELIVAIRERDRLIFVVGPKASSSIWCQSEWQHALEEGMPVHPVLRLGDMTVVPADLRLFDVRDFRSIDRFEAEFQRLVRQLSERVLPAGKLVAIPTLPPYHLPNIERLRELRELFLADHLCPGVQSGAQRILGLHGMGGTGKSLLAMALAKDYQVRRSHPDGVFWLNVGQQRDLVVLQETLAGQLGCQQKPFRDVQEGRFVLSAALHDKEVLLILDDVWDSDAMLAFDVLGPRCRMLITTQNRGLMTHVSAQEYPVGLPSRMEARALLARCAGCPEEKLPAEADTILEKCGNLPLELSICGGRVAGGATWADVLDGINSSDSRFYERGDKSVFGSIGASIDGLSAPDRKRFLELGALFLEDPLPDSVARLLWGYTGGMSAASSRDLLQQLADRYLITRQPARLPDREPAFAMHTLVRLCLDHLNPGLEQTHGAVVDACRSMCQNQWWRMAQVPYWRRYLAWHMARAQRWNDLADVVFGGTFELLQRWTERGEWLMGEECLRGLLDNLPPSRRNRARLAVAATQLSRLRQLRGDYLESRILARKAIAGIPFGTSVRTRLVAWQELGNLELASGRPSRATLCYLRKLTWAVLFPGRNTDEVCSAMRGLAAAQRDRHSWRLALWASHRALWLARRIADRAGQANALILKGATLKALGRYGEAEESFRQAQILAPSEVFPMESSHLLTQWGWMIFNQATLARAAPERATTLFRSAVASAELAGAYSLLADALTGLAWSRLVQGDDHEARECFARARSLVRGAWFATISDGVLLGELSIEYVTGNAAVARAGFVAMIDNCRQRRELLWRSHACVGLGACDWHTGNQEAAQQAWEEARYSARRISPAAREVIQAAIKICREDAKAPPR